MDRAGVPITSRQGCRIKGGRHPEVLEGGDPPLPASDLLQGVSCT